MTYGAGTRSYNRSTEARRNKKAQREATAKYLAGELKLGPTLIGPICTCRSFRLPHELSAHARLADHREWRPWEERVWFDQEHNCYVEKTTKFQERVR